MQSQFNSGPKDRQQALVSYMDCCHQSYNFSLGKPFRRFLSLISFGIQLNIGLCGIFPHITDVIQRRTVRCSFASVMQLPRMVVS